MNEIETAVRQWLERVVIGLNLCPFAARPVLGGRVRVFVSAADSELELLTDLQLELARLESGDLPLDQLMGGYQRGAALLQFCRDRLQAVEEQIKVLDEGTLKPWAPQ